MRVHRAMIGTPTSRHKRQHLALKIWNQSTKHKDKCRRNHHQKHITYQHSQRPSIFFFESTRVRVDSKKEVRGIEPRSSDSKSEVIAIRPYLHRSILHVPYVVFKSFYMGVGKARRRVRRNHSRMRRNHPRGRNSTMISRRLMR